MDNSLRTFEISLVLNTRAAARGTVFRKNDRSSVRIARLTGGRNISDAPGMTSLEDATIGSIGAGGQLEWGGDSFARSKLEAHCG